MTATNGARPRRALALAIVAAAGLAGACDRAPRWIAHDISGLRTIEVGEGRLPFVLIHGYGATAEGWLPFTSTIRLPEGWRFVCPEGPETTSLPDGPPNGRAWWRLGLDAHRRPGDGLPDLSATSPPGLAAAGARIRALLGELASSGGYPRERQMLAGFSQGAMVAADIAFTTDEPMEALVLLSPTVVNEAAWGRGMPSRRRLRVFVSHGRRDDVLPFDVTERLQRRMREAGLTVTWVPFDGGHDVPAEVVGALNRFLAGR